MSTDKKKMTKEEKINKAKKLMEQLNDCELSKDELRAVSGGCGNAGPWDEDTDPSQNMLCDCTQGMEWSG